MLVLSRKPGEKIHVGSSITITLVHVQGSRVRIGIEAPADVAVVRSELNGSPGQSAVEPLMSRPPPAELTRPAQR